MAFTDRQTKALNAKLRRRHVKTRDSHGSTLSYVEGWHAIAEANRIFGFDSWDRQTLAPDILVAPVELIASPGAKVRQAFYRPSRCKRCGDHTLTEVTPFLA